MANTKNLNTVSKASTFSAAKGDLKMKAVTAALTTLESIFRFSVEKGVEVGKSIRDFQAKVIETSPEVAKAYLASLEKLSLAEVALTEKMDATATAVSTTFITGFFSLAEKLVEKVDITAIAMKVLEIEATSRGSRADLDAARLQSEQASTKLELERVETEKVRRADMVADRAERAEEHQARMKELNRSLSQKNGESRL